MRRGPAALLAVLSLVRAALTAEAAFAAEGTTAAPADSAAFAADGVARVVAFADVHGAHGELVSLLQAAGVIDSGLRWKAGATHLVSLGDLLDRGAQSRRVMDLLMRLEEEARAAGGKVHVVLGNHELMNLTGELQYVSPADLASYRDLETAAMRDAAFTAMQRAGRFPGKSPTQAREKFEALVPAGLLGHRAAFSPVGRYGKWLLTRPVLVRVNDVVFVHGGLPPSLATTTLGGVNETLRADVSAYAHAWHTLQEAALVDVDTPFADRVALARRRLALMADTPQRLAAAQAIDALERAGASPAQDPRGPLWYRGTALCNPLYETDTARAALGALGAKEVVVGHTVTATLEAVTRLDGRATLLDTGMLALVYRGRPAALVLEPGSRKVIYAGADPRQASPPPPARRRVGPRPGNLDDDALERLLAGAPIVEASPLPAGNPDSQLLTLREGALTVRGIFRAGRASGWERELAAYRLDRLLGLEMIPATVEREYQGRRGALQFRIDDAETVAALEQRQARSGGWCALEPQYGLVAAFDLLTGNTARSASSVWLSPAEWQVRLTDHATAFTRARKLPKRADSIKLPDELARRLAALSREQLRATLGGWLKPAEIDALLARRDALLRGAAAP